MVRQFNGSKPDDQFMRGVELLMRSSRVLLTVMVAMLWLTGCQPVSGDNLLSGYQTPDPLVLRTPEALVPVPDVTLVGGAGERSTASLFRDRWSLLYVGYSYCPDVCPTELGQLALILPRLEARLPEVDWQVVFLSVDPERDSVGHLQRYTAFFSEAFVPLTGSREAIDAITSRVRAGYRIEPHETGERAYTVDHDTSFRLIDPKGRMLALLPGPHDSERIVEVLTDFMNEVNE